MSERLPHTPILRTIYLRKIDDSNFLYILPANCSRKTSSKRNNTLANRNGYELENILQKAEDLVGLEQFNFITQLGESVEGMGIFWKIKQPNK